MLKQKYHSTLFGFAITLEDDFGRSSQINLTEVDACDIDDQSKWIGEKPSSDEATVYEIEVNVGSDHTTGDHTTGAPEFRVIATADFSTATKIIGEYTAKIQRPQ